MAAEIDPNVLKMLVAGAEKAFENAESLFREAEILAQHGAVARALCLHQISLEECSKVDNLGAWATSLVLGHDVDQNAVLGALKRHRSKNKINAYMLAPTDAELQARERGDWKTAISIFRENQTSFHESSNDAKNASLYVDWIDSKFVSPEERITSETLGQIADRNANFLGFANNNLNTLRRMADSPEQTRELLASFMGKLTQLRDDPQGLIEALDEFFESAKQQAERK